MSDPYRDKLIQHFEGLATEAAGVVLEYQGNERWKLAEPREALAFARDALLVAVLFEAVGKDR